MSWTDVETAMREASQHGTVGVSLIGPDGDPWSHHGQRQFPAASTVKIGIMVEIYRRIDRGETTLDDRKNMQESDRSNGSGVMRHMHNGLEVTVGDLLYLMMSISDNTATNMLIDLAGMDAINATMRDLGMASSNLGRKMMGRLAIEGEQENLATPEDYTLAIGKILDGTAASRESCEAMVATLEKQQNSNRIARHLPDSDEIRWGTKTGSNKGVTNDAGFIITPKGTLIIAVYAEGLPDQHAGEKIIGDIARAACVATGLL
ncbi:serine hydrolase [soil metagenome]